MDDAIKIADAITDNDRKSRALSSIAQSNKQEEAAKLFDISIQAVRSIDKNWFKVFAMCNVAQSLAKSNKQEEAVRIAKSITTTQYTLHGRVQIPNPIALASKAQSLAQSNKQEEASQLFDEAIRNAKGGHY